MDKEDFNIIYKPYAKPHSKYCVQAWSPAIVKDIEILEKV